ncbi:MAG: MFS transporter, partial [Chloroflexi bacterium]|nr:MFS transporter [Chloroflexota bacterium]
MHTPNQQPVPPAAQSAVSRRAMHYPDFRILWFTTGLVAGGIWFQQVTLGWLAYDLTRDALHTAGVVGVRTLPLLLSPITGVIADRVDRRKLLLVDQVLVTVLVFAFALVLLNDLQQLWHLYVFALVFGTLWAANNPVRQVLIANTVPREALMNATAMISMSFNLMRALGPAIGGFVIAFFGPGINFLIQGVLFLLALLVLTRMRTPYYTADRAHNRE